MTLKSSFNVSMQKRNYEGFKALTMEPDYMQESNPHGPAMISLLK
jgi:hypothetical protein